MKNNLDSIITIVGAVAVTVLGLLNIIGFCDEFGQMWETAQKPEL